jgi:hypothetical protein
MTDWNEIHRRWMSGDSARYLARQFGISHVAILKRAKREGWTPGSKPKASATSLPATRQAALGMTTRENAETILARVAEGAPVSLAAATVGLTDERLEAWLERDAELCQRLRATEAQMLCGQLKSIKDAGKRGQWQAASWFIERHHLTRGQFANKVAPGQGIIINISPRIDKLAPPIVLDVTPTSADSE